MPPRAVRMPLAACMPWMSSGLVSARTRITAVPSAAVFSASSAVNTACPTAAPGEAASPLAITSLGASGSSVGCSSWSSAAGSTRPTAVLRSIRPSPFHLHRHAQRRFRRALAAARLQHVERSVLDRELHVLHVAVMRFQPRADGLELGIGLRHRLFHRGLAPALALAHHFGDGLRRADAGDDVLALRVDEEFAVEHALAGGRIAREGHARGRGLAAVAEHHGLHVHRRAPVLGNGVQAAIGVGARRAPRAETPRPPRPRAARAHRRGRACPAPSAPPPCRGRRCAANRPRSARCRARCPCSPFRPPGFPRTPHAPCRARPRHTSG